MHNFIENRAVTIERRNAIGSLGSNLCEKLLCLFTVHKLRHFIVEMMPES